MNHQLVIRLGELGLNAEQLVDWNLYDDSSTLVNQGRHALKNLSEHIQRAVDAFDIAVIVPGEAVLLTDVSVPSQQLRQIKQALPYAVEELIADDIESVHLALPNNLDPKKPTVDVAVVSHQVLVDWLDELHSNRLSPSKILIDVLCVPQQNNTISLLVDENNVLIRTSNSSGIVVQKEDLALLLSDIVSGAERHLEASIKPALIVHSSTQQDTANAEEVVAFLRDNYDGYDVKAMEYQETVFEVLANAAIDGSSSVFNLLQGGYAAKKDSQSSWYQWRFVASIAVIGLLVYLTTTLFSGWYFQNQADGYDRKSVALYKQLFPNERRVVSPKKQMENHLRSVGVGSNGHFLKLLSDSAQQISNQDNQLELTIEELRFDSDRGDIQFEVQSASIDKLDLLKQALAQQGLEVTISSAIEQDDYIVGRFAVRNL